ncbi:putative Transmembrane protein [Heracleum sosnowskyi]|uniref:Transmembrane protein n=1 Tax=Heracleum sosnowskyi TaxID=360622 RepID=A0AAD8H290_9APIA|nr:putative Transmembrane protein [Heracleum sosnowskyi]
MSSLEATMISGSSSGFDEHRWIIHIRKTLNEDPEEETDIPVSIFNVPKSLLFNNVDTYVPQQVALGPYHYWRPELYEMERYKLGSAKRTLKTLQSVKFQHLVDQFTLIEPTIRACYHKYLDISGETLAWMMVIDVSFLLEFLHIYAVKSQGKVLRRISSRMSHLIDFAERKSAHNAILRDMIMLENQIPMFLLRKMLEFQLSSVETADDTLLSMLGGVCKVLSPFRMTVDLTAIRIRDQVHILDFLYQVILPTESEGPLSELTETESQNGTKGFQEKISNYGKQLLDKITSSVSVMVSFFKRIFLSRHVQVILRLPWLIISNLPGFSTLKQPIEHLCSSRNKDEATKPGNCSKENEHINKPPTVEEISIPSVTELCKSGISFVPTNGSVMTLGFDSNTSTFFLPTITLDVNTEIVLRNLVAYEACNASGPLVFTRYTELMNGIIDTEEDARLLRERGIVLNLLKSDEEVANLWNGMSRSIRLTKVQFLDKMIEDVNKFYNGKWAIKIEKFIKLYVFKSWKILILVAAVLLLVLMSLQVFSSMYRFYHLFHMRNIR